MKEILDAKGLVSADCWSREYKDNVEEHKEMNKHKSQEPEKAKKTNLNMKRSSYNEN